jgi:hypothetical protein
MLIEHLLGLIALVLLASLVFHEEVTPLVSLILNAPTASVSELELRKEVLSHASFFGSAVAATIGLTQASFTAFAVSVVWFVLLLWVARKIAVRIAAIEEHEKSIRHRKMAGMVRSVVRSELIRAMEQAGQEDS